MVDNLDPTLLAWLVNVVSVVGTVAATWAWQRNQVPGKREAGEIAEIAVIAVEATATRSPDELEELAQQSWLERELNRIQ